MLLILDYISFCLQKKVTKKCPEKRRNIKVVFLRF